MLCMCFVWSKYQVKTKSARINNDRENKRLACHLRVGFTVSDGFEKKGMTGWPRGFFYLLILGTPEI